MLQRRAFATCVAILGAVGAVWALSAHGMPQADRQAVILITLDGARTEEIFGGLDVDVFKSTLREKQRLEDQPAYRRFWAETPAARREKLMPFFWTTLMREHGSDCRQQGARQLGHADQHPPLFLSRLLGNPPRRGARRHHQEQRSVAQSVCHGARRAAVAADADEVTSRCVRVVECVRCDRRAHRGSADCQYWFRAVRVAGARGSRAQPPADGDADAVGLGTARRLHVPLCDGPPRAVRGRAPSISRSARPTIGRTTAATIACSKPTPGPTPTCASSGPGYRRIPEYRGRTHLLITTDHGRGHTTKDWRDHGAKVEGAQDVWIALVSPSMPRRGEWREHPALQTNQVAATLASWMGVDWRALRPAAGLPIPRN